MPEQSKGHETTELEEETTSEATEEKIQSLADKAAEQARKTEQHYDKDHDIFSK
jgi:hypothetical protein